MSAAVEATRLGKRYRSRWALRGCTFEIPAGRVAAIVGPNGAGKTTLLHLLCGLVEPSEGEARVLGMTPGRDRALLARLGFVAQDVPLYGSFTAAETLEMGRRLNPRWDPALARARFRQAGIGDADRVGDLSGGMRAQLALSLALAKRPEAVLLDEPLANLDPLARREFLQSLMEAATDQGLTVLLSSHLVNELERVCDYLVVLSRASVQVVGAIDDLLEQHRLLVGPRRSDESLTGLGQVIRHRKTERQSTVLARLDAPPIDPQWTAHEVGLEELVMGYLEAPEQTVMPGPRLTSADGGRR